MGTAGSTRIEVTAHRSDLGRWRAAQRTAAPSLRDYVSGYFASQGFLPRPLHERQVPSREVTIVLNFAAPHRIVQLSEANSAIELRSAWIVALQHRHQIREALGARDFMVIRLTPIGAQMLLKTRMDLLTDRAVALEDIDSQFSQLLMGHAEDTRDWTTRFDIAEKILAARLASAPLPPAGLQRTWQTLQDSPNRVNLTRLPQEFGCSRRHLIAQFHRYFGMAPKTIARISRFHLAVARLHRLEWRDPSPYDEGMPYLDCASAATDHKTARPTIPWADWALDCGYYDQSHFINEFRTSSGMSPLEFLQRTRHG